MKRQETIVLIFSIFAAMLLFVGCSYPSAKDVEVAKETVEQETVSEKELLYDNGKNSLVVFTNDWAKAMVILQEWNDRHPTKYISAISSDSISSYGVQTVFLVFYYDVGILCKAAP